MVRAGNQQFTSAVSGILIYGSSVSSMRRARRYGARSWDPSFCPQPGARDQVSVVSLKKKQRFLHPDYSKRTNLCPQTTARNQVSVPRLTQETKFLSLDWSTRLSFCPQTGARDQVSLHNLKQENKFLSLNWSRWPSFVPQTWAETKFLSLVRSRWSTFIPVTEDLSFCPQTGAGDQICHKCGTEMKDALN